MINSTFEEEQEQEEIEQMTDEEEDQETPRHSEKSKFKIDFDEEG